jgi:hypothetical protein
MPRLTVTGTNTAGPGDQQMMRAALADPAVWQGLAPIRADSARLCRVLRRCAVT